MPISRPANNTIPLIVDGDLDEDLVVGPNNLAPIQISGDCNSRVTIGANNCASFSLGGDNLGQIDFGVNNLGRISIAGDQGQIAFGQTRIRGGSQTGGQPPASSRPSSEEVNATAEVLDRIRFLLDSKPILFKTGSSTISSNQEEKLGQIVKLLEDLPQATKVEVSGHTDNKGTPAGNQTLSQKRADSVVNALVALGIPTDQLIAKGYGQAQPIDSNDTEEGRTKNRRIEISVAPTKPKREFAGKRKGRKTILIAWSFDDGPHPVYTDQLNLDLGINNVTWFIVKKNMRTDNKWHQNVLRYKKFQAAGGEIGLHAQHVKWDHPIWFPAKKGTVDYKDYCYDSIETAMADLKSFKEELEKEGIKTKFTRLPGGLISQLQAYAIHFGLRKNGGNAAADAVLKGESFGSLGLNGSPAELQALKTGFQKIASDFATLKASLKDMGLLLWGNGDGSKISRESWEAQSSGTLKLDDNITRSVTLKKAREKKALKETGRPHRAGRFERLAGQVREGESTRSFIVLSHDTHKVYYEEILKDRDVMEAYAEKKGIKIEYVTMSTLFKRVTGKDASTFKPDY